LCALRVAQSVSFTIPAKHAQPSPLGRPVLDGDRIIMLKIYALNMGV